MLIMIENNYPAKLTHEIISIFLKFFITISKHVVAEHENTLYSFKYSSNNDLKIILKEILLSLPE